MAPRNLPALFSSLARTSSTSPTPTRWTLLRTLKSSNPNDITGSLHGTAAFTPLLSTPPGQAQAQGQGHTDLLYSEEGSLPTSFGPGLRWTKKYIWRLSDEGRISVWFVKVDKSYNEGEEEADYLFHEFDFTTDPDSGSALALEGEQADAEFVTPPIPPEIGPDTETNTRIVAARGNHLCINDMYRTAYAFRVAEESGEVLSWASRHVVKGPKKGQDIVNLYSRDL
ncbi:uncharacterized protein BDV17DRAFT_262034 [Aspergillus undulatus]|uniref:uncharacterized protein n=1 Tax=Aspergillus undulatus TaxID=1810928 RepID=UPI003CCCF54D